MIEPAAALPVAVVARRLGVAPDTLRTWDRRYGIGPSGHRAGSHRRYGPDDLARLEVMRRLTLEGVPAREAARVARASTSSPAADAEVPAGDPPAPRGAPPASARGLTRAAMAMDATGMEHVICAEVDRRGVAATWEGLLVPVLTSIGHRWETGGAGVEVEHLLSETVLSCLRAVTARLEEPVNVRPVFAACAPEEQHSLALHALAAAMAERGVAVRVLGARLPSDSLSAAVRRCGPAAVLVWSQGRDTADRAVLTDLVSVRPAPSVLAGGPGWGDGLPACATRVEDLSHAVEQVLRALGR